MTRMTPLLERNEQFARTYTPAPLGLPAAQVLVVTCLDHRVDPAIVLGLRLGDAPVIRNAGGRVTPAVVDDLAYLAFLAGELWGGPAGPRTPVGRPVLHPPQRGTRVPAPPPRAPRVGPAAHVASLAPVCSPPGLAPRSPQPEPASQS